MQKRVCLRTKLRDVGIARLRAIKDSYDVRSAELVRCHVLVQLDALVPRQRTSRDGMEKARRRDEVHCEDSTVEPVARRGVGEGGIGSAVEGRAAQRA